MTLASAQVGGVTPSNNYRFNFTTSHNRGGTVLNGGNTDNTVMTSSIPLVQENAPRGQILYGSTVIQDDGTLGPTTDTVGIQAAVSGMPFKYNQVPTGWIMPYQNMIGGAANANISVGSDWQGGGRNRSSIMSLTTTRTLGSGATTQINVYARPNNTLHPERTKGGNYGALENYVSPIDGVTAAVDNAANVANAIHVPGEITYFFGAVNLPTSGFYRPHDVYES